jgi:hypothetical protein
MDPTAWLRLEANVTLTIPTMPTYMGDHRDGDEQWYLYRTQNFCANAAFSLYGIRRKEEEKHNRRVRDWRGCSRKHFIDSYFTYGGADVLLQAVGIQPDVYYSNRNYAYQDGQRVLEDAAAAADDGAAAANDDAAAAANDDDDSYTVTSNAECIPVDGSDVTHYHSSNNNNNNGQERQQEQEEYTYMSTMGCSRTATTTTTTTNAVEATFVMARFEADTCDGNKYLDTLDAMDSYNAQHDSIGNCHRIWDAQWTDTNNNNNSNNNNIFYLMQNAWTCDFALYPDGCPDPYGQKAKFLHALQIAARGGNAQLSLRNMNAKRPLRIVRWRWEPWSSCGDIT